MKKVTMIVFLLILLSGIFVDKVFAMDISFEWSQYKEGECSNCLFYDLYKNNEVIIPDIPITTLEATVVDQEIIECTDYSLTVRTQDNRSGKSTVVRICPNDGPTITKIKVIL